MTTVPILQDEVRCDTAGEFLQVLSVLGSYFTQDRPITKWIFRGQGTDWPLLPAALRADAKKRFKEIISIPEDRDFSLWHAERDAFSSFFEMADRQGLALPGESQQLRDILETLRSERGDYFGRAHIDWEWDSQHMAVTLPLLALAQHYRIPTRMLDWTRRPWVAAFFAGSGAWNKENLTEEFGDRLVVWGAFFPNLGKEDVEGHPPPIRIITAPSATNPNLRAQQGIFTMVRSNYTRDKDGKYIPMDEVMNSILATDPVRFGNEAQRVEGIMLQKFSLPQSESKQLLILLAESGITWSSLFPGFASITDDLKLQVTLS